LENLNVINIKTDKVVTQITTNKNSIRLKLWDDTRGWRSVTLSEVLANAGLKFL